MIKSFLFSIGVLCIFGACNPPNKDSDKTPAKNVYQMDLAHYAYCSETISEKTQPMTVICFDSSDIHRGEANAGDVLHYVYEFTNEGDAPLIIQNTRSSCGCVVPRWPKDPIPPKGKGVIEAKFNTKGKKGKQSKRLTLTANTIPSSISLTLRAYIIPDSTLNLFRNDR